MVVNNIKLNPALDFGIDAFDVKLNIFGYTIKYTPNMGIVKIIASYSFDCKNYKNPTIILVINLYNQRLQSFSAIC